MAVARRWDGMVLSDQKLLEIASPGNGEALAYQPPIRRRKLSSLHLA
jgi:hypothetical protein